ncbi:hypothetical protein R5R35_005761 [Gryllus longicercus]|uniref:Uncharacterized protein n=1 Tax=Gryllus longicercus TaxID=2509291 RepID=A0AAN9W3J3_9ORTH
MCYDNFYDIKQLQMDIGPMNMGGIKFSDVKIKVLKESPHSIFYKMSYTDATFQEATVIKRKKTSSNNSKNEIMLTPAFTAKPGISERKKRDQIDLVHNNLIPKYYQPLCNSL